MKLSQKYLVISSFIATSILSTSTTVLAQTNINEIIKESDRYNAEKITQVNQLRDLSPADWSYEAVRNLAKRYGCIQGFTDSRFRGNKPSGMASLRKITRYEFAAGLNSCLEKIEGLISSQQQINLASFFLSGTLVIREEDGSITIINDAGFIPEPALAALSGRSDNLETQIALFEDNQFSTTTKLTGEVVFGLSSVLNGSTDDGETDIDRVPFLGNQVTLELATSFTGEDKLSIELEAANLPDLADVTDTFQGELSFSGSNDNDLELDLLAYTFPLGDNLEIIIGAAGLAGDDIAETINFLEGDNGGNGAISNFGSLNPIYETAEDAGLGIIYEISEAIELSAGYLASPANESTDNGGIFNASYGAIAQAIISPSDRLNLAFTYIHSRDQSDTDMGSDLANLQSFTEDEFGEAVPTVSDSYGAEFSYELSDFLVIGGWGGLSKITTLSSLEGAIEQGTEDVWNWAINLSFPDLGQEGNLGGIVIGAEPWVTNSTIDNLGEDENISLHLEAFYQYHLSDYLAITPGIVWITAPSNNNQEDDLVIGAIRTTFAF